MSLPAPYYQDDAVTIFHGDGLWLLPELEPFDALVTDPPYSSGGQFRGDRMGGVVEKYVQSGTYHARPEFSGDNRDQRAYMIWLSLWAGMALARARAGAAIALFTDWRQLPLTTDAIQVGGWVWRGIGTWDKTEGSRPRLGGLRAQAEFIVWGTAGPLDEDRNPIALPGVLRHPVVTDKVHIAEKPLPVMGWLVQLAPPGGTVVDPFMGSGSTLVAARRAGRRAVGIDLEESWCEVAANRLRQGVLL